IGFAGFVAWMFWAQVKRDFFPWLREPTRVPVSVGWADRIPEPPSGGPCRPETAKPPGRLTRRPGVDAWDAVGRGEIEIECGKGTLVLDVRRPARLVVIAPPKLGAGQTATARVQAYDVDGVQLRVGDQTKVAWRFEGSVGAGGEATPPSAAIVKAATAGEGTVEATLDGLSGRAKILVE